MNYFDKFNFLQSFLGKGHYSSNSKECSFFCCFCVHHKPKLFINIDTDYFQCFPCGKKGRNLFSILKKVGTKQNIQEYIEKYRAKTVKIGTKSDEIESFRVELPKDFRPIIEYKSHPLGKKSYDYLTKIRGITDNDILRYKIGVCFEGEYAGKIIFPSFNKRGFVNLFTSRSFDGKYWTPKTPKGYKSSIILNELNLDFDKPITLVEGFGDLFKANENTCPLLGSSLIEDSLLFATIVANNTKVFLGLDPDAKNKSNHIAKSFMRYDVEVYTIPVEPYKDIGEMPKEEFNRRYALSTLINNDIILRERIKNI